jgi:hypothetical protein
MSWNERKAKARLDRQFGHVGPGPKSVANRFSAAVCLNSLETRLPADRFQMSIFDERIGLFTLLVVIGQGYASRAEDAHRGFFI